MYNIINTHRKGGGQKVKKQQIREALQALGPVAKGTLSEVRKPCARANCAACQAGTKHRAFLFSYADGGKRRCMYVAPGLVPALHEALRNGRAVEAYLHQSGPELIRQWREAVGTAEAR
jgi:hypothetical protein